MVEIWSYAPAVKAAAATGRKGLPFGRRSGNLVAMDQSLIVVITLAIVIVVAIIAVIVIGMFRAERGRAETIAQMTQMAEATARLTAAQAELAGQMKTVHTNVSERLDGLTKRLGDGLSEQTEKTGKTLLGLQERLAVIDAAQKNLDQLSQNVVDLRGILANKQARGAFGQVRLEDLVKDALPPANVAFEATLSNGKRVDCLIRLPNPPGSIGIDSKFPLESWRALQEKQDGENMVPAQRAFRADLQKHVKDIAEKYIVPGETADWALMFLPSEAVYAELQTNFPEVVDDAHRRKVAIVSPTSLWATLNTVRAVLKDARMREQTSLIQKEVETMLADVGRLDTRVGNLQRHFDQANEDMRQIRISTDRVLKRGEKVQDTDLGEDEPSAPLAPPPKT
jgi:DNA recombination protein RmuC